MCYSNVFQRAKVPGGYQSNGEGDDTAPLRHRCTQAEALVCQRGATTARYALRVAAPPANASLGPGSADAADSALAGSLTATQSCGGGDGPCPCQLWRRFVAFADGYALRVDVDLNAGAGCQLQPSTARQHTPAAAEAAPPIAAVLDARSAAVALVHGGIAATSGVLSGRTPKTGSRNFIHVV